MKGRFDDVWVYGVSGLVTLIGLYNIWTSLGAAQQPTIGMVDIDDPVREIEDHISEVNSEEWEEREGEGEGEEGGRRHFIEPNQQEVLKFFYLMAEDQARRKGYIHRGVTCNGCGQSPIRGNRFRCTECADVDLCSTCEEVKTRHDPRHILLKINVPIPLVSTPRWVRPSLIPLASSMAIGEELPRLDRLPRGYAIQLAAELGNVTPTELEVLHTRFKMYCDRIINDKNELGYAITTSTLRTLLVPHYQENGSDRTQFFAMAVSRLFDPLSLEYVTFKRYATVIVSILYRGQVPRTMLSLRAIAAAAASLTHHKSRKILHNDDITRFMTSWYFFLEDTVADSPETHSWSTKRAAMSVGRVLDVARPIASSLPPEFDQNTEPMPFRPGTSSGGGRRRGGGRGGSSSGASGETLLPLRLRRELGGQEALRQLDYHLRTQAVQVASKLFTDLEWSGEQVVVLMERDWEYKVETRLFGDQGVKLMRNAARRTTNLVSDWLDFCIF